MGVVLEVLINCLAHEGRRGYETEITQQGDNHVETEWRIYEGLAARVQDDTRPLESAPGRAHKKKGKDREKRKVNVGGNTPQASFYFEDHNGSEHRFLSVRCNEAAIQTLGRNLSNRKSQT